MQNKLFFPQSSLDLWIPSGHVDLREGELSLRPENRTYRVEEAVTITKEITTGEDPHALVGTTRDKASLVARGAEIYSGSMILGDQAYEVTEGWIGSPTIPFAEFREQSNTSLNKADAAGNVAGVEASDEELLGSFLRRVESSGGE